MKLPSVLLRRQPRVHKNTFGHVLVLAGSRRMLGAAALTALAATRSGAGLVTVGVPRSLNTAAQNKVSNVIMTLPLKETRAQSLALSAYGQIKDAYPSYKAIALGPGLSRHPGTRKLILKIIATSPVPLIIDADAVNALSGNLNVLLKTDTVKILTPHPGEMSRLIQKTTDCIERDRAGAARAFAEQYNCVLLLKGAKTIVAAPGKKIYTNTSGNAGMAAAGSGDVLTGMVAAFTAQGLSGFEAARWGAYLHGKAGDLAARAKTRLSMIAPDIIDYIPEAVRETEKID
jgi:NAD(P)H-hydrate epimerase